MELAKYEKVPGLGGYKLWLMLISLFGRDFLPGRDRFFVLLRRKGLMLPKPKPRHTTNSNHRYHKWTNPLGHSGTDPLCSRKTATSHCISNC